jgi:hypothetical protein
VAALPLVRRAWAVFDGRSLGFVSCSLAAAAPRFGGRAGVSRLVVAPERPEVRMFRVLLLAFAGVLLVLPPLVQPSIVSAQTEAERVQARAAFQRGVEAYAAERFQEALASFQEAYRIAPHPSVRVNMANCYERLARPLEALDHFERFLAEAENASPEQQREVRAAVRRLRQQVGEVFVRVQPDGATVRVGDVLRTAPVLEPIELARGVHRVEVSFAGHRTETRDVEVRGGDRVELTVTLVPAAPEVVTPPPEVLDADVADAGTEDDTDGDTAEVTEDAFDDDDDDGGGRRLHFDAPTIAAGAATVVLLGTTIGLGVAALGAESDFDDAVERSMSAPTAVERNEARADGRDADRRASRLSIATDVFAVTTVLAAGATVFFLLWDRGEDTAQTTQVAPIAGPNAGGVLVRRSF